MNLEYKIHRLNADYCTGLYCNTRKKIMQVGWERKNSRTQKTGFQFINYRAVCHAAPGSCNGTAKVNT